MSNDKSHMFAVLGAGSWGTALAMLLARNAHKVNLWSHNPDHARQMQQQRCNSRYLPELTFPESLSVTSNLEDALKAAENIFLILIRRFPLHSLQAFLLIS